MSSLDEIRINTYVYHSIRGAEGHFFEFSRGRDDLKYLLTLIDTMKADCETMAEFVLAEATQELCGDSYIQQIAQKYQQAKEGGRE
jgi:hypothetical protein